MDFSEFIKNILSSSWLTNIKDALVVVGATVLTIITKKTKSKLDVTTNNNSTALSKLTKNAADTAELINTLKSEVISLREENKKIIEGVKALGDVVSISFLESKAISSTTKMKIVGAVDTLKNTGFEVAKDAEVSLDSAVDEILEEQQVSEEQNKEVETKAEDTNQKSLSLYNEILDNEVKQ